MGTLQPLQLNDTAFKNNFKLSFSYGKGEQSTTVFQTIPEFEFSFFKNNLLQLKIPFLFIKFKCHIYEAFLRLTSKLAFSWLIRSFVLL